MKKIFCLFIFLSMGLLCLSPAFAIDKTAQTGLQFLKIDVGARAAAMGGSYAMVGNDATAMFYNPAGLAYMEKDYSVFFGRTQWLADITYNAGGVAKSFGNFGVFGLSVIASDYGDMVGTMYAATEQGYTVTGSLNVGAYAVGLSYAKSLTNKFSIGGQVKYCAQQLGSNLMSDGTTMENDVNGFAYDFGTMFYPGFKSFRLGMFIRNFSPEFKYVEEGFELPLTFVLGFAMDILDFWGEHSNPLLISVDAIHPRDYSERIHVGAEYLFMNMFALRAGYKFNYDVEGLSAGLGFKADVGGFAVDLGYAYSDTEFFDAVNRISVGFSF